ncbi:hypothetical protein [Streptosporangium oxazolinicum]
MGAAEFDLHITQGSRYRLPMTLRSKPTESQPNPGPLDLTGFTARSQIRPNHGRDTAVLHEMTTENGSIVIDGTAGKITLTIPGAVSSLWLWLQGVYDFELVDPDGEPERLLQGAAYVDPEVTR